MNFHKLGALAVGVLLLWLIPFLTSDKYVLHLLIMTAIWVILASSFNLLLSTGQLSLGHMAFFGIGAYTSALLAKGVGIPFLLALPAGGFMACLAGLLIGRITLKMRGAYFVLVTFALAEIARLVAVNWVSLTGGPMGLRDIPMPSIAIPGLFSISVTTYRSHYYLAVVIMLITIYVMYRLFNSRYGRAFAALRQAEGLAASVGIGYYDLVTVAVVVSAFLAGVSGSLYAHYVTLISPEIFAFGYMITLLIMVIGGGRNTIVGPIVGATVFTILPELLRSLAIYHMLVFGILLILTVRFMPEGLVPRIALLLKNLQVRLMPPTLPGGSTSPSQGGTK